MELILTHVNADFDALASLVAAHKLYPRAVMVLSGGAETNVREFLRLHEHLFPVKTPKEIYGVPISRLIIVDASMPPRLGDLRNLVYTPQVEIHIFDHHLTTPESIVGDFKLFKPYGATTTILLELLREKQIAISPTEATLFALGIYEETGSLSFTTTTPADVETVAYLLKQNANLQVVSSFIQPPLREKGRELLNQLILSAQHHYLHGNQITIVKAKSDEYIDELALITHRLKEVEQSDAIFTLAKMKDRIYIVGRSKGEEINVGKVLETLGGGGHPTAAAASIKGSSLKIVEKKILKTLKQEIKPLLTARLIMSHPVRSLDLKEQPAIQKAEELMTRYGITSLLILDQGKPRAILTKKEVDRAIKLNLKNAKVNAFASRNLIAVKPETSLKEIAQKMIENNIGRLPVIEKGKAIGIISRSDILRFMHYTEITSLNRPQRTEDYLKKLPSRLQEILKAAGEAGEELGFPTYIVGGFVRDLLLGVENFDLDIVVEGDGIALAKILAARLAGRYRSHEKFRTALVILPDGFKIDIATCRTEFYARPAALPEVTGSSIKQDLYRRDFTINTMAIKLISPDYGSLVDFFSARRDLQSGIIRILHNLSFIEDPTRIFRAIRFEQRFHFKMDQSTENLLKSALSINIFREMPIERMRDELMLILSEPRPLPALLRMQQLKILRLVHPKIFISHKIREYLEEITNTLLEFKDLVKQKKVEAWMVYFSALVSPLSEAEIREIGKRFKITRSQENKLVFEREMAGRIIRRLSYPELKNSELYFLLSPLSLEVLLYLLSRSKNLRVRQRIAYYLNKLYQIEPLISGKDLKAWGYPPGLFYRKALNAVLAGQLNGEIKSKSQAKDKVKKLYPKGGF